MAWRITVSLDEDARLPLFAQIARGIVADIRRGRLAPGTRLPGSRTLAHQLGVHRNTILAAYDELSAQGWTTTRAARGTYVNETLPEAMQPPRVPATAGPESTCFSFGRAPRGATMSEAPRGALNLSGGLPDGRLVPSAAIGRAMARVLRERGGELLGYGDPQGLPELRAQLAQMLGDTRGVAVDASELIVTRGSQMALYLVAQLMLQPGAVVAVEAFGYPPAWRALRSAGARLRPIPIDDQGLRIGRLSALAASGELTAVYVTPHHQYPTTVTLSASRRVQLLQLAERYRFAIIEDDYDHEFHYRGRPVLPLASADRSGAVIYIGTLSKILAPALRIGYIAAPRALIRELTALRAIIDRQGDRVGEAAIAELLEDGELQRHARRARRRYETRRDALLTALDEQLGHAIELAVPDGGLAIWARLSGVDVDDWASQAAQRGVLFAAGSRFHFSNKRLPYARFGFANCDEREIRQAVRRAAKLLGCR